MWYVGEAESGVELEAEDSDFYERSHTRSKLSQTLHQRKKEETTFAEKCRDVSRGIAIFGTVPPPLKIDLVKAKEYAGIISETIQNLQPDAVQVYDIVEEKSRSGSERPFPFFATHEPRVYSKMLSDFVPSSETIVYRALTSGQTEDEFAKWVTDTVQHYRAKNLVVVGGSASPGESILTVPNALQIVRNRNPEVYLGGITIPERHRDRGDEPRRIQEKTDSGLGFFTSQVVYNADNAIWLLEDYDQLVKTSGKQPARIIFAFAPFASENTVTFLRWLGVEIPEGTAKRVLSKPNIKARADASVQVCWENWKRILDASKRLGLSIPIGFSVESVSKSRTEQEAAAKLFVALREELDEYYKS